jgi:hypothetical protein
LLELGLVGVGKGRQVCAARSSLFERQHLHGDQLESLGQRTPAGSQAEAGIGLTRQEAPIYPPEQEVAAGFTLALQGHHAVLGRRFNPGLLQLLAHSLLALPSGSTYNRTRVPSK